MDVFRLLERSEIVLSFEVVDHKVWHTGSYLRMRMVLRDGSELHSREFVSEAERNYSFHWQTGDELRSQSDSTSAVQSVGRFSW